MQANSQQQQQKQSAIQKQAAQTSSETEGVILCPNCGAELPEDALFCSECSAALKQRICPKCGAANRLSSDICESCKAWLLEHQCKFCYAELPDDATFCAECGSPKEGIPCPHCGNLSIFDFCLKCGKPVSEKGIAEAKTAQAELNISAPPDESAVEEEIAKLEAVINSMPVISEPVIEETKIDALNDVYDPDDYYEEPEDEPVVIEEEPVRKSLFSDSQMNSIRQAGSDIDAARHQRAEEARIAEERRIEAERQAELRRKEAARLAAEKREADRQAELRRQEAARQAAEAQRIAAEQRQKAAAQRAAEEEERQRQIRQAQAQKEALQRKLDQDRATAAANSKQTAMANARQNKSRTFSNAQEARCFHNARRHPSAIGWLCNYSDTVHLYNPDGGSNDCSDASQGGCDYFGKIRKNEYNLWEPDV